MNKVEIDKEIEQMTSTAMVLTPATFEMYAYLGILWAKRGRLGFFNRVIIGFKFIFRGK